MGSYNSNGDRILETEFTTPGIRYVFLTTFSNPNSDTDTYYTLMKRHLVQLIVARCRVEWGYGVTGELGIEEQMEKLFQIQLRKSRDHNNKELGKI
ncbi:MAG: hypothetical protein GWN00_10585, partial [Aliifodinibius sp.]|nr:hypothetical protein [Fodinibius sp.]NIV11623.1 hypothetical protein [Fodinibius sp.]NIY25234.1 hypothetical protein [Fodinibius sp.]